MDILHDLADDSQSGCAAYILLFQRERDETLKALMVDLAQTVGEPSDDLFKLLALASVDTEPEEVKIEAQRVLLMSPDPRAIPVWQGLLSDHDPSVRETAEEQIEQLRGQTN